VPTSVTTSLTRYPARYFAAWNGHRLDGVDGLLAPVFSWTDPSLPAELTELAGAHGFFQSSWAAFPDIHFEAIGEPLLDEAANRVAAEWRMTGTHTGSEFPPGVPASGKAFDVLGTTCSPWTARAGPPRSVPTTTLPPWPASSAWPDAVSGDGCAGGPGWQRHSRVRR
jgi:hypothetical protein